MRNSITASDLYNFKKCRYRPFLDYNGDTTNKGEIHPLVKLLWDADVQHEDRLINDIKIIDSKTDWPRTSYSIKSLCKYLGYRWAASDASGAASVVWINDYLAGNMAMRDKILQYNEDDCRAMLFLKDKLIKMQGS